MNTWVSGVAKALKRYASGGDTELIQGQEEIDD